MASTCAGPMKLNIRQAGDQAQGDPTQPPRNGNDQPKPFLPDGSKRAVYGRTSSAGGILEDTGGLMRWKARLAAYGALRYLPELADELAAMEDIDEPSNKQRANQIVDQLQDAAGSSMKAMRGTLIHELSERVDRDEDLGELPDEVSRVLHLYREVVQRAKADGGLTFIASELYGVNDSLKLAGTMDRIIELNGKLHILDVKTSGSMDYSLGKFAMQMLGYAGMCRYNDIEAQQGLDKHGLGVGRSPLVEGREVDQHTGYILWIPQHGESAALGAVNLDEAVEGFQRVEELKEWRNKWKRKALRFTPMIEVK